MRVFLRGVAGAVALAHFLTGTLLAHQTESNFWTSRRRQNQRQNLVLAGLPPSRPISLTTPPAHKELLPADLASALDQKHGTLRGVDLPKDRPNIPVVLHIQDVHMNADAQANISAALRSLLARRAVDLVALEGAFQPLDLSRYRAFPDQDSVREAADFLLRDNKISGPIHAALVSQAALPKFVGVDDEGLYGANVAAYRLGAPRRAEEKQKQAELRRRLAEEKRRVYSPGLRALDLQVDAYRQSQTSLGGYLAALAPAGASPSVRHFLETLRLEKALDMAVVEKERSALVERLAAKLDQAVLQDLLAHSAAYRAGSLGHGDFYRHLRSVCRAAGVDLARYPAMEAYVRYALAADKIDAARLFLDITEMERKAYSQLANTPAQKDLVARDRQAHIAGKLLDFSLSSEEWREYAEGTPRADTPWELFYREAQKRDEAMAKNLLREIKKNNAKVAVLVAGGFHAQGVTERLRQAGVAVVSFTPKIKKTDSGAAYLSVFSQEKTPLDKMFSGSKLFLPPEPFPPAVQNGAAPALAVARRYYQQIAASLKDAEPGTAMAQADFQALSSDPATASAKVRAFRLPDNQVGIRVEMNGQRATLLVSFAGEANAPKITAYHVLSPGATLTLEKGRGLFGRLLAGKALDRFVRLVWAPLTEWNVLAKSFIVEHDLPTYESWTQQIANRRIILQGAAVFILGISVWSLVLTAGLWGMPIPEAIIRSLAVSVPLGLLLGKLVSHTALSAVRLRRGEATPTKSSQQIISDLESHAGWRPSPQAPVISVDIGGTFIQAGVVSADGRILFRRKVPTQRDLPGPFFRRVADLIKEIQADAQRLGIEIAPAVGIGCPGRYVSDGAGGTVIGIGSARNLGITKWDFGGANPEAILKAELPPGIAITVRNDAIAQMTALLNALLNREDTAAVLRGKKVAYIGPGTGLGGGFVTIDAGGNFTFHTNGQIFDIPLSEGEIVLRLSIDGQSISIPRAREAMEVFSGRAIGEIMTAVDSASALQGLDPVFSGFGTPSGILLNEILAGEKGDRRALDVAQQLAQIQGEMLGRTIEKIYKGEIDKQYEPAQWPVEDKKQVAETRTYILGGSVAQGTLADLLQAEAVKYLSRVLSGVEFTIVVPRANSKDAGLIGAASFARDSARPVAVGSWSKDPEYIRHRAWKETWIAAAFALVPMLVAVLWPMVTGAPAPQEMLDFARYMALAPPAVFLLGHLPKNAQALRSPAVYLLTLESFLAALPLLLIGFISPPIALGLSILLTTLSSIHHRHLNRLGGQKHLTSPQARQAARRVEKTPATFVAVIRKAWHDKMAAGIFRYRLEGLERTDYPYIAKVFNPKRGGKRPRQMTVERLNQPFNPEAFHFDSQKMRPEEIILEDLRLGDVAIDVVANVNAIEEEHSLILPERKKRHNQFYTPLVAKAAFRTLRIDRGANLKIGFNSVNAFASINHLHLQLLHRRQKMGVEKKFDQEGSRRLLADAGGVALWELGSWPIPPFVLTGADEGPMVAALTEAIDVFHRADQPFNLLFTLAEDGKGLRVYIFPRQPEAPSRFGTGIAFFETAGDLIFVQAEGMTLEEARAAYENATESELMATLEDVRISDQLMSDFRRQIIVAVNKIAPTNNDTGRGPPSMGTQGNFFGYSILGIQLLYDGILMAFDQARLAQRDLRALGMDVRDPPAAWWDELIPPPEYRDVESIDGRARLLKRAAARMHGPYGREWARHVDTVAHLTVVREEDMPNLEILADSLAAANGTTPVAVLVLPDSDDESFLSRLDLLAKQDSRITVLRPRVEGDTLRVHNAEFARWAKGKGSIFWTTSKNPSARTVTTDIPTPHRDLRRALDLLRWAGPLKIVDFQSLLDIARAIARYA